MAGSGINPSDRTNHFRCKQDIFRWNNIQQQIILTKSMVRNYELLLAGEFEKFSVGESDLFIVNTRETQLIEAEIKLLKLLAKEQKIILSLQWANGLLN